MVLTTVVVSVPYILLFQVVPKRIIIAQKRRLQINLWF